MKIITTLLITLVSVATTARAQFLSLPPSSTTDGVNLQSIGLNGGASQWANPSTLGGYAVSSDAFVDPLHAGSVDSHAGLTWQQSASASALAAMSALNATGGFVRAIYVGETAGWQNDFGYTYTGKPTGPQSFTALQNIQSVGAAPTVHFGDYFDISLTIGEAKSFDFWYNSVGAFGLNTPAVATGQGGIYTAFKPTSGDPTFNQFIWAQSPLKVSTWIPSTGKYAAVDTYMVGVEDWRGGSGSDLDYSDFRFGLQFFDSSGTPLGQIPEPASVALFTCFTVFIGAMIWRRKQDKDAHQKMNALIEKRLL